MTNRLMGLSEEERLAIEQTTGLKTQGAQIIVDAAVSATQEMMDKAIREVQEVIGPHGAITRLQAGGVQIAKGLGIAVYEDGVLKTTVDTKGNLFVGSDTTSPTTTSFSVFVNDQIYNNEQMGAGDLLIGDNSSDASNVKYDASEGQLQFRLGATVNVYVDTDGKLKAGGGVVALDDNGAGVLIPTAFADANSYKFVDTSDVVHSSYRASANSTDLGVQLSTFGTKKNSIVELISTATDESGSAGTIKLTTNRNGSDIVDIWMQSAPGSGAIYINHNKTAFTYIYGPNSEPTLTADPVNDRIGIKKSNPSYPLDVAGDINISTGSSYRINGSPFAYTNLSGRPTAEVNANDIFRCDSPGGTSAWAGTFTAAGSSGTTIKYSTTSGTAAAMTPTSTSQLAKMRLYNTTRGNYVLISNHTAGTITSTANYPANWANGDVLTIASQTVVGTFAWVDLEITSGPTGKALMFIKFVIRSATVGNFCITHPFETYALSKVDAAVAQAANQDALGFGLVKITSNMVSFAWNGSPTYVIIREGGYLE